MAETQRLDSYPQSPGCDFFTGSTRTPCVDTGVEIDRYTRYGRIYVSEDTVGNWARMFEWIAPDDAKALAAEAEELENEVVGLQAELESFAALRAAMERAGFVTETDQHPSRCIAPTGAGARCSSFAEPGSHTCARNAHRAWAEEET